MSRGGGGRKEACMVNRRQGIQDLGVLVEKTEVKRPPGRLRCRWEANIRWN